MKRDPGRSALFTILARIGGPAHKQLLSQPDLSQELRKRAQSLLDREGYPTTLPGRVRYHLRESWGAEPPRMEALARRLGISQRSLHRSLAREGLDYRTLLNQARCEVASHLLRQRGLCVKQVSIELGFSSPSAFYRAFKRWMGCRPLRVCHPWLGE